MNILGRSLSGLLGLFIDDGRLAFTLVVVLTTVGLVTHGGTVSQAVGMTLLVCGTIIALITNVIRAAGKKGLKIRQQPSDADA